MKSACEAVQEACDYIREWVERRPTLQEESITDWLLDFVSKECNYVHYLAFNRYEEARITGADWEWWILFSDAYALRIRVQAKRLYEADNRSGIGYANKHGFQHTKLIDDSASVNAVPFYCFYAPKEATTRCKNLDSSVLVSEATLVRQLFFDGVSNPISGDQVAQICVPLRCLFCCPLTRRGDWRHFFSQYFSDVRKSEELASKNQRDLPPGVYLEIPAFVESLLNSNLTDKTWIESEFRHELGGICGLLVIDLRDSNER
jgi:hypothetical protein